MKKFGKIFIVGTLMSSVFLLTACSKKENQGTKGSESSQSSSKLAANSSDSSDDSMNLDEIKTGDYSSIQGTWKSKEGETIVVKNNTIKMSAFKTMSGDAPATIKGLTINIPSQTDANGNPKVIEDDNDYKGSPLYTKKMRAFSDSGKNSKLSYNFVCLGSYTITAYSQINFLPATFTPYNNQEESSNYNSYNDASDVDRIFLSTGQDPDVDYSIEYKKVD